jgi:hypothetical protein
MVGYRIVVDLEGCRIRWQVGGVELQGTCTHPFSRQDIILDRLPHISFLSKIRDYQASSKFKNFLDCRVFVKVG